MESIKVSKQDEMSVLLLNDEFISKVWDWPSGPDANEQIANSEKIKDNNILICSFKCSVFEVCYKDGKKINPQGNCGFTYECNILLLTFFTMLLSRFSS